MITWTIHSDGRNYAVLRTINGVAEVQGVYNTREEAEQACPNQHTFIESRDPDAQPTY